MHDTDLAWSLFLLLLDLFFIDFVTVLTHLVETVILWLYKHVVLQHVLLVRHSDHGHGLLLTCQTCELLGDKLLFFLTSERESTLLVGRPLQDVGILLAEFPCILLL